MFVPVCFGALAGKGKLDTETAGEKPFPQLFKPTEP